MKILSKKPFYADGLLAVICILTAFIEPPISSRNFWTIFSFILLLSLIIFFVLPHARAAADVLAEQTAALPADGDSTDGT